MLASAFPWSRSLRKVIRETSPNRIDGSHILICSDYSDQAKRSKYSAYTFLFASLDNSTQFVSCTQRLRNNSTFGTRRMSYKGLNDAVKRKNLSNFLCATDHIEGLCITLLVHRDLINHENKRNGVESYSRHFNPSGKWSEKTLNKMLRTAHIIGLALSELSQPYQDITWISDEDDIVANDDKLTDLLDFTARLSSLYISHPLGIFAMNTPSYFNGNILIEDFLAVPDLVSGAFAELMTSWCKRQNWVEGCELAFDDIDISEKSKFIGNWFCSQPVNLKKCVFSIDKHSDQMFGSRKLNVIY